MLKELWMILLALAFICFTLAVLLSFIWGIPDLLDELSGRKAKRQIKVLHDINANTGMFGELSTDEIYSSIPSYSFLDEELSNMDSNITGGLSSNSTGSSSDDDVATSELSEKSNLSDEVGTSLLETEAATSFLNDDDVTGFIDDNQSSYLKITILEEQSSL